MTSENETYLGDLVYAQKIGPADKRTIILTVRQEPDDSGSISTIYLKPEVLEALLEFVTKEVDDY